MTFKKQPTEDSAIEAINNISKADFKNEAQLKKLAKEIVTGKECSMICHMLEVENNLGRSLVIDLSAKTPSKFRQIDHRSIESITF